MADKFNDNQKSMFKAFADRTGANQPASVLQQAPAQAPVTPVAPGAEPSLYETLMSLLPKGEPERAPASLDQNMGSFFKAMQQKKPEKF